MARLAAPTVTGDEIAADAKKYIGLGYVYGGDASAPGVWDCSSFVSYVLGHDLHLALPNNGRWGEPGYPPNSHGPVVTDYASWTGARTVSTDPNQAKAGDLCCFVGSGASGHIGIATGANRMVSALDTTDGTIQSPIAGYGPYGAPLVIRRLLGIPAGGGIPGPGGGGGGAANTLLILMLLGGTVAGLVLAAALAGLATAAATGYAVKRVSAR